VEQDSIIWIKELPTTANGAENSESPGEREQGRKCGCRNLEDAYFGFYRDWGDSLRELGTRIVCVLAVALMAAMSLSAAIAIGCEAGVPSPVVYPDKNKYALIFWDMEFEYLAKWKNTSSGSQKDFGGTFPGQDVNNASALANAGRLRDILVNYCGWINDTEHIKLVVNAAATHNNTLNEIANMSRDHGQDLNNLCVFVHATHGWTIRNESLYYPKPTPLNATNKQGVCPWEYVTMCYDSYPGGTGAINDNTNSGMRNFLTAGELDKAFSTFRCPLWLDFIGCCGGGAVVQIAGPNRIVFGVGDWERHDQGGIWTDLLPWYAMMGYTGKEFSWVRGVDQTADANGDGMITLQEAYAWSWIVHDHSYLPGDHKLQIYMSDGTDGATYLSS
jgi:hypothetical protein